tara:strand:+ start:1795 stop:2373 length:579 start_codon:yes stop_codon:yes gene_type:complete
MLSVLSPIRIPSAFVRAVFLGLVCLWALGGNLLEAQKVEKDRVEAAMALQLLNFVTWPSEKGENDEILLGVFMNNATASDFEELVESPQSGLRCRVKLVDEAVSLEELSSFDVLYFDGSNEAVVGRFISRLDGEGILLMGSFDGFLEMGGMVNFVKKQKRVTFDIDVKNSSRMGIGYRAQLLRIANRVEGDR